jgi:hypothetical protein
MANPLDNRQIDNLLSTTMDDYIHELVDNFYKSNPLLVRLSTRGKVMSDGGAEIRTPYIYGSLGGGSYGRGDTFDTSNKEFMTQLILQWKMNYAPVTIFGLDMARNQGAAKVIDLVESFMQNCELTIKDNMGTQLFGDGTGNGGKDIDGLRVAIDDTLAYGGITRDSSPQGTAIKAQVNTVGGAFSLALLNSQFGKATFGQEKPDLIISNQRLWDAGWARVQPQQRFASEDLKKVGMDAIQFNGADWIVDSHCPDDGTNGTIYGINTKYVEWRYLAGADFHFRMGGGVPIYNQDAITDQMITYCNVVVKAPRMCFRIDNVQ